MIIGIDPGPIIQSYVLFDGTRAIASGDESVESMINIIRNVHPDVLVAIEHVTCYGMPVGSEVFSTVFNEGRLYAAAAVCRMVPRTDAKLHLCNSAKAKDPNIRQALIDKIGPVGTKKAPGPTYGIVGHLWAALAIAVTATDLERTPNEFFPAE